MIEALIVVGFVLPWLVLAPTILRAHASRRRASLAVRIAVLEHALGVGEQASSYGVLDLRDVTKEPAELWQFAYDHVARRHPDVDDYCNRMTVLAEHTAPGLVAEIDSHEERVAFLEGLYEAASWP